MRKIPRLFAVVALASAIGHAPAVLADATTDVLTYEPGAPIPVSVMINPSQEKNPSPLKGSAPVTVKFPGDGRSYECLIEVGTQVSIAPGQAHNVGMNCKETIAVTRDGLDFSVYDGEKVLGKGKITPS